ncbi:MAG: hypothetical protein HC892_22235 [Saprospiraceae bacterium]|nr:hypothetical protein [Saprospiraceae bacterium]
MKNLFFESISALENIKQFYFTNLKSDGSIDNTLMTANAQLSVADALFPVLPERVFLPIEKGKYKRLTLNMVKPEIGMSEIQVIDVKLSQESIEVSVAQPGIYKLVFEKVDGSTSDEVKNYFSSEAYSFGSYFAVVELFLDNSIHSNPVDYLIPISHRLAKWRYYLVEYKAKKDTTVGDVKISLEYDRNVPFGDKLPANVNFKEITNFPAKAAKWTKINERNDKNILKMHLYESEQAIPFLENIAPVITLKKSEDSLITTAKLPVPAPETFDATIFINI